MCTVDYSGWSWVSEKLKRIVSFILSAYTYTGSYLLVLKTQMHRRTTTPTGVYFDSASINIYMFIGITTYIYVYIIT